MGIIRLHWIILAILIGIMFAIPAHSQVGFTAVSGQVFDPGNNPYSNCSISTTFVPSPTATRLPTLSGAVVSTPAETFCDANGNFVLSLPDNTQIVDGHTGGVASQWTLTICAKPGAYSPCFSLTTTISGTTQVLTTAIRAVSVTIATSQGPIQSPFVNNVVQVDGKVYPFTAAGVNSAIAAAVALGAGGGQSMAVHISPTPAGISMGTTSITMNGSVNVICDGIATAVFDYSGTGSTGAFDWPLGTNSSQLLGCKVELFGTSGTPTCFSLEGSIAMPNVNNAIINAACATEQTSGTAQGIALTSGGSGVASGISSNLFRDIIFGGINGTIKKVVVSNGDFNNQFLNMIYRGTNSSGATPFIGSFENDRMDISMSAEGSTGVAMLTLQGNSAGNIIHMICDLSSTDTCLNESGGGNAGGNIIEISDSNLTPLGTKLSSSLVHFCTLTAAITGICTDYVPAINFTDSGTCTMASGTCTAQSLSHTYSAAPKCSGSWTGTGTLTGILKFPSTTTTTTPASSVGTDTAQVNWFCWGPA